MSESIAKKAVTDAREITRLAVNAAKNQLVEQIAPQIRRLVENGLRSGKLADDVDRLRRAEDGYGETEFEEGLDMAKKDDDLENESMSALFPSISEGDEEGDDKHCDKVSADDDMEESSIPTLGEAEEEGDMDEEIEISEAELQKYYKEGLQTEADVSKGFKDMEKNSEEINIGSGIADEKSGEHPWEGEEPPHKQDFTVKESVKQLIIRGIRENKRLKAENRKLAEMIRGAQKKLVEMNLFNSKILHVSKFMNRHKLTAEQKKAVIEGIDRAVSIDEVKRTYGVLESSLRSAGTISESANTRRARVDGGKRRTAAAPKQEVLRESVGRNQGSDQHSARLRQLAGLTNGKR